MRLAAILALTLGWTTAIAAEPEEFPDPGWCSSRVEALDVFQKPVKHVYHTEVGRQPDFEETRKQFDTAVRAKYSFMEKPSAVTTACVTGKDLAPLRKARMEDLRAARDAGFTFEGEFSLETMQVLERRKPQ